MSITSESYLEILPNELFLVIFSYLKPDEIIQGFRNLNQRFQSLVYPFARHPVLFANSELSWIKKYMLLISNDAETIKLSLTHITAVFCGENSYPNLRSVTIFLTIEWEVELNIENESPLGTIISALKVLAKCSFERVQSDLSYSTDLDYRPCSAIRRVTILGSNEENISKLYTLAPELTYLKVWLRSSRTSTYHSTPVITQFTSLTHLVELNINVIDLKSFDNVKLLINHSQTSFRQLTLNLGQDLMIDGKDLEKLLVSHTSLENFSFISQLSKKKVNVSDLLQTFQSEWWLNTQRSPVLIHETDFDAILITSIPCSFSNIFGNFQFSSNLRSWHFNKENLNSRLIRFTKIRKICLSNKQPITFEFLQFFAHTFCSEKQILECNRWGLISEHELFKQFMNRSIIGPILPNVTRLKITSVKGLSPVTLAIWLLLASNVRVLQIEYMTFSETMEWATELNEALLMGDQRLKMIFQRIRRITISDACCNFYLNLKLQLHSIFANIFSLATIE